MSYMIGYIRDVGSKKTRRKPDIHYWESRTCAFVNAGVRKPTVYASLRGVRQSVSFHRMANDNWDYVKNNFMLSPHDIWGKKKYLRSTIIVPYNGVQLPGVDPLSGLDVDILADAIALTR